MESPTININPSTFLIICPFDSIMKDQLAEAQSFGLKAATLTSTDGAEKRGSQHYHLLFASAQKVTKNLLESRCLGHRLSNAIVINESHSDMDRKKVKQYNNYFAINLFPTNSEGLVDAS